MKSSPEKQKQYSSAPAFMGNTFQDLLRLYETVNNTKPYI
jgi:hypothetical protein